MLRREAGRQIDTQEKDKVTHTRTSRQASRETNQILRQTHIQTERGADRNAHVKRHPKRQMQQNQTHFLSTDIGSNRQTHSKTDNGDIQQHPNKNTAPKSMKGRFGGAPGRKLEFSIEH